MAENNSFGGVVGSVAVTTVNSMPPSAGNFVPGSVTDAGLVHSVDGVSVGLVQPSGIAHADGINTGQPIGTSIPPPSTNIKKTSFQITSVTVDSSASNDGGDDSADDLDESHTEDSSDVATDVSRHTSESRAGAGHPVNDENFTRNDIFYNPAPPSSMNIAPVIPTSSQYGLAIVPEGLNNQTSEPPPPTPPVLASEPVNDKAADPDKDIVHNRFKVVKIVSTEPFKKGRWMCMDYFDHTTTTTGTSATLKDTTPSQPQQQTVPQTHIQQQIQPGADKVSVNVVNVQQGPNVTMTSSPPQASHAGMNNVPPDSQQQPSVIQQTQPTQHVIQSQMQNAMPEQDVNTSGLPNGNGTHYHVNHSHNVQGVTLNHVPPASSVISNATDTSAFSTPIPNHNPDWSTGGNAYQTTMGQQQQQQQYYNNTGVLTGIQPRPVSVAPTSNIPNQQQANMASQQQSIPNQQQPISITGQVPIMQNQSQPQNMGQIGPQSSISQNQPVPMLPQTMSTTSQIHQAPVQVTQPSHLPAQSLPHGAHAQMTGSSSISNAPSSGSTPPQQQQQQHTAQSLGHNMLQQNKPAYMNTPQQLQQSQPQAQNQFQQPPSSQQQQMMSNAQQSVIGSQQSASQQAPPVGQVTQAASNQQQQPQSYQTGVMMQNIPGLQQQVHVQQMNPASVSQHSVQMQQPQPTGQTQAIYTTPGQMMGMQMSGQPMGMQQTGQGMIQQPQVMQNQTMMQQQPQMVTQQHHQQMMGMAPQQQSMVSQPQNNAPQQSIMSQNQVMSQMMQNTQMSGMVTQTPLVSQQGVIPQQQGIIQPQGNLQQQNMIQQIPQQQSYPSQTQQQTINNQGTMQQPLMQQFTQPQPNPVVQQQQMMTPQSQSNIMAQQMGQPMTQGQQQSQIPIQQQQQQQSQANQQQQTAPQQQQQPQVNMQAQAQQNVYQTPTQQMQVSQSNVPGMQNMQPQHSIIPPVSQSVQQIPSAGGMPLQANSGDVVNCNASLPSSESSSQSQSMVQQQSTGVSVPNANQVQPTATPNPADVHIGGQQNPPSAVQVPTTSTAVAPAITSLSAAATVIIDGVNSLGEAASGGAKESEEGESATGTNTVAIDNKIEQAMDLVKSHLMFAVREEVEVLKEKISELMERITQLEYENTILRATAPPETLAQLQKTTQHPAPNVNESHQGFS